MDLSLTAEQRQTKQTLRDLLEEEGGVDRARAFIGGEEAVVSDVWGTLAELDLLGLTVPVDHGGFGEDSRYLALLLEETGRVALPGPYPETAAFAVPLIAELGSRAQREVYLPAIRRGEFLVTFAVDGSMSEATGETGGVRAERVEGGIRLSGTAPIAPYGTFADLFVLPVQLADHDVTGVTLLLVDADHAEVHRRDSVDPTRPYATVTVTDHTVADASVLGAVGGGGDALERARDRYTVARCAMLVGAAERTVELSTEYAKTREQFGHPIGRFQAVKHRIADMWMRMRASRSTTYYAAWALATESGSPAQAVSAAKAYAVPACIEVFEDDIQNHGATGYTWAHDAHVYLRGARAFEGLFGRPSDHLDVIAREIENLDDSAETAGGPFR